MACFTAANRLDRNVGTAVELFSFPFPLPFDPAPAAVAVPADGVGCPDAVDPTDCSGNVGPD